MDSASHTQPTLQVSSFYVELVIGGHQLPFNSTRYPVLRSEQTTVLSGLDGHYNHPSVLSKPRIRMEMTGFEPAELTGPPDPQSH